jgi:hypothetical protein
MPPTITLQEFSGKTKQDFLKSTPYALRKIIHAKDDSDEEDEERIGEESFLSKQEILRNNKSIIVIGTRLKLLANVYLRNIDETANIFFPRYILTIQGDHGKENISDFFRIPPKGEEKLGKICLFASGGLHNAWEKTVEHIQRIFFGAKVKVIRASWIQKHLAGVGLNLEEEFRGKENELHSEYYYDLFFKHFFVPWLKKNYDKATNLRILAYSWWEVCNGCENTLTNHKTFIPNEMVLSYEVSATRRYHHRYPESSIVQQARVSSTYEAEAWDRIWGKVTEYVDRFENPEEKKRFWTQTKDGLELCKWLGQAFVENAVTLEGREAKASKKGDILKFYQEMVEEDTQKLQSLLDYLRQENWDLSCWYKGRCPDPVQPKWKHYWRQIVIPHFGWQVVGVFQDKENNSYCEMCGKTDVVNISLVFHPKFRVLEHFLKLPEEEQKMTKSEDSLTVPFYQLPSFQQTKRRQSLHVGSECVKVLTWPKKQIEKWLKENPHAVVDAKWREQSERQAENDSLEEAEKGLKERLKKKKAAKRK